MRRWSQKLEIYQIFSADRFFVYIFIGTIQSSTNNHHVYCLASKQQNLANITLFKVCLKFTKWFGKEEKNINGYIKLWSEKLTLVFGSDEEKCL